MKELSPNLNVLKKVSIDGKQLPNIRFLILEQYINLFDNHKIDRRLQDYCSIGDCKFSQTAYFKV